MRRGVALLAAAFAICAAPVESGNVTARPVWAGSGVNLLGAPSPDGRFLSFVDAETGDLAVRNIATGVQRRLTRNRSREEFAYFSAVSPDSRRVAYAWFNDAKFYDLRIVPVDGGEPRLVYRNEEAGFVQPCAWSPDGKHILTLFFRKDNISQIALVSSADGSVRILKSLNWVYPKRMDFSPDGRWIVYDAPPQDKGEVRDIYVLSADGSQGRALVDHPAHDVFPLWSPDGKRILFVSDRSGSPGVWSVAVVDGKSVGEPEQIRSDMGRILPMGIARDGTYYYGVRSGSEDVYVAAVDPPRILYRFPAANGLPAWSPDGEWLAYLARRGTENYGIESRVIVIRSVKTGQQRELSPKLAILERIRWSPDGRWLLVAGADAKSRPGLFRVEHSSGVVSPVVVDPGAGIHGIAGEWAPGGKTVFYAHNGLRARNLETGEERVLCPATPAAFALSTDGAWLAFLEAGVLKVMPVGGGEAREVSSGKFAGLSWTRDGQSLLFTRDGKLWRMPLESGEPQALDLPADHVAVHPGGRWVALAAGQVRNEVWALQSNGR